MIGNLIAGSILRVADHPLSGIILSRGDGASLYSSLGKTAETTSAISCWSKYIYSAIYTLQATHTHTQFYFQSCLAWYYTAGFFLHPMGWRVGSPKRWLRFYWRKQDLYYISDRVQRIECSEIKLKLAPTASFLLHSPPSRTTRYDLPYSTPLPRKTTNSPNSNKVVRTARAREGVWYRRDGLRTAIAMYISQRVTKREKKKYYN